MIRSVPGVAHDGIAAVDTQAPPAPAAPTRKDSVTVRYLGFAATHGGRQYRFSAETTAAEPARECTLEIPNDAFTAHQLSFQDGPQLCARVLLREAAGPEGASGLKAHARVSEADLAANAALKRGAARRPRLHPAGAQS